MLVAGLCRTCSETTLLVFPRGGSFFLLEMGQRNRGSCQFPNFLIQQERWRDLSGLYSLDIEDGLKVIRLRDRIRSNSFTYMETMGSSVTKVVYRCLQSVEQTVYGNIDIVTAEYIAYVTTDEW